MKEASSSDSCIPGHAVMPATHVVYAFNGFSYILANCRFDTVVHFHKGALGLQEGTLENTQAAKVLLLGLLICSGSFQAGS